MTAFRLESGARELRERNLANRDERLEQRIAELRTELTHKLDRLDSRLFSAELRESMERTQREFLRWGFFFWLTLFLPLVGLWLRP